MRKRHFGPILVGLAAALASCAGPASPDRDVVIALTYEDFEKNQDFSGTAEIPAGGTLTIKLFSNGTTGFAWSDPSLVSGSILLELTGHQYIPPASSNAGAGGEEVWSYRTTGTGTCRIHAEYKRFVDTTPTWTFGLTVSVL